MRARLIKPCYLVSLKSTITGGVSYQRVDLDKDESGGTETLRWETTRVIDDKAEHERATQVRNKATGVIRRVCYLTSFGLICPLDKGEEFDEAVKEARRIEDEFNQGAVHSRVSVYILKGQIASSDEEAARALAAEVTSLIAEMQRGIEQLDVEGVRTAARKAREMAATFDEEQSRVLNEAIVQARKAASTILRRVEKKGEKADVVLSEIKRNELDKARAAFLDYSEQTQPETDAVPAVQKQRFADLDVSESESNNAV